jgi:hypothetical protein
VDELAAGAAMCVEVTCRDGVNEVLVSASLGSWPYVFEPNSSLLSEGYVETPPFLSC